LIICGSEEVEEHDGSGDIAVDEEAELPSRKCARRDETDDSDESLPSLQVAFCCLITTHSSLMRSQLGP